MRKLNIEQNEPPLKSGVNARHLEG